MPLVEDDNVVQTITANTFNNSFYIRILPGASGCRDDFFDEEALHTAAKSLAIGGVSIAKQILSAVSQRKASSRMLADHPLSVSDGARNRVAGRNRGPRLLAEDGPLRHVRRQILGARDDPSPNYEVTTWRPTPDWTADSATAVWYLEFTASQTMEHFLTCHQHAFEAFHGVPSKIMIDNLKSAVLKRLTGEAPLFNPRYLDFAMHSGFTIAPCGIGKGHEKGRVENGVRYVKKNLLARQSAGFG